MSETVVIADLVENSVYRRTWLLYKALETAPIDNAIALARAADEFVIGSPTIQYGADRAIQAAVDLPSDRRAPGWRGRPSGAPKPAGTPSGQRTAARLGEERAFETATDAVEGAITPSKTPAARAQLSADQREWLIERLAAGATNPELASEFGLSRKQVQGFRMGLARKGAKRRPVVEDKPQPTEMTRSVSTDEVGTTAGLTGITGAAEPRSASSDEVVRYLRQQDDVVVWQGEGKYLVNGRFQLALPELIDRANKMRHRQGKPGFKSENDYAAVSEGSSLGVVSKQMPSTIRLN